MCSLIQYNARMINGIDLKCLLKDYHKMVVSIYNDYTKTACAIWNIKNIHNFNLPTLGRYSAATRAKYCKDKIWPGILQYILAHK